MSAKEKSDEFAEAWQRITEATEGEKSTKEAYTEASLQRILDWCKVVGHPIESPAVKTGILCELRTMFDVRKETP